MALENIGYTPGGPKGIAADTIDGTTYQIVKLTQGVAGSQTLVSSTAPLPTAMYGTTDAGDVLAVPVTSEGHMEVAIHSPRLPFGEVSVESLTPVFQVDAVYGLNTLLCTATTDGTGGTATAASGMFQVSTGGTTAGYYGAIQSTARLRYRAGQGVVGRFSAIFSTGQTSATQVAGYGTGEAGFYFGYNGTAFGILSNTGGVRAIYTLTVTTASTATNNYNVELNGTTFNVTATSNGSTIMTAYEISRGTYTGWSATQIGSTVVFLSGVVGAKAGAFSLAQSGAGTPAAGSYATTLAGAAVNDTWVPQTAWNGDVLDGSGSANNPSGILLDPTKGNVYQIQIQYLGFGTISFQIEVAPTNGNNSDFVTVHTIRYPNTATTPSVSQPSFPFTMSAANVNIGVVGTTTVKSGSFAGFIAGTKKATGPRMSYYGAGTSSTTVFVPLFTFRNNTTFGTRANQTVVNINSITGAARGGNNSLTAFYLVKNATLSAGVPNFTAFSAGKSCTSWDTAATAVTWATNDQVVWVDVVAESGQFSQALSDIIEVQPGETYTLCCKTSGGAAGAIVGSVNTREDQ